MTDAEKERVLELCGEIQKLMPHLDSVLITEDTLMMASYEMIEALAAEVGIDIDDLEDDVMDLIGYDDDDENNGGLLQ